jgi:tRNA(fMet)-specific endonuclease VapC
MTVRFMLDTDSVSFALRGHGNVGARIIAHKPSELAISSITLTELRYGAERRKSKKLHQLINVFTDNISVLPFDEACGAQFGKLASELVARGTSIGDYDALIAAHAMELRVTLVTVNVKHFNRITGLKVENWT